MLFCDNAQAQKHQTQKPNHERHSDHVAAMPLIHASLLAFEQAVAGGAVHVSSFFVCAFCAIGVLVLVVMQVYIVRLVLLLLNVEFIVLFV